MSPKQLLTHLNLLDSKGRVTNAAILLFGKNPQRFFTSSEIKCIQFYGNDVVRPVPVYQIYYGDLFELVEQAISFVLSRIDIWVGRRESGSSVPTEYELPVFAVTEAIVNAIAHRDYTSNGSVQVMLFRNRLEVWSPGVLPKGLSIEELYEPHKSIPVNPLIATPFFLSGDIEKAGTGTSEIVESCLAMGLQKPEFIQKGSFRVTLWRKDKGNVIEKNEGVNDILDGVNDENEGVNDIFEGVNNENEGVKKFFESETLKLEGVKEKLRQELKNILIFIYKKPLVKTTEIAQFCTKSNATVERYLKILKDNNLIEYVGSDKTGGYRIKGQLISILS